MNNLSIYFIYLFLLPFSVSPNAQLVGIVNQRVGSQQPNNVPTCWVLDFDVLGVEILHGGC